jgi:electron transfer flavoprotein alpha subunit
VSSALRGDEAELGSSDHGAERRPTARLAESLGGRAGASRRTCRLGGCREQETAFGLLSW